MWRVLLPVLFLLAACAREVSVHEIPGSYAYSFNGSKQIVTITADGHYNNTLFMNDVVVWSDNAHWTYEQQAGKYGVTFARFRFGIPGHTNMPALWFVVPRKTVTGHKELCFNADLGRCFITG